VSSSLLGITLSYLGADAFGEKEGEKVAAQKMAGRWGENSFPPYLKRGLSS